MTDPHPRGPRRLHVAVMIDLYRHDGAGGHVKAWERLAEAAALDPAPVDLTVFFLGRTESIEHLSPHVRYAHLRPAFSTERLIFVKQGAGETDLAGHHAALARKLGAFDVLHATDTFAFAKTALKHVARTGGPLVYSIHTDYPKFSRIYAREAVENLLGRNPLSRLVSGGLKVGEMAGRNAERETDRFIAQCDHVLVSNDADARHALHLVDAPSRVGRLRRGVDRARFAPGRADRARLAGEHGVPTDGLVALFVGRVDESKGALLAAEAVRLAREQGRPVHLLVCGKGKDMETIRARLGAHATLTGPVAQEDLGWIYPSADLFLFPSLTETAGNVALEAMASGLPVIVSSEGATAQWISTPGEDGLVVSPTTPETLAEAMATLADDPVARRRMGAAARATAEARLLDWRGVLEQDLVPVWTRVFERPSPPARRGAP